MRKGENPSEVLAAVKERVKELNDTILPKGVTVEPFYDRTSLIDTTLHTVFKNLLEGALLVIDRAVPVPGALPRGGDRRRHHSAGAARHLHRPAAAQPAREPALAGRHGFRHHRGRRGDRAGEHLPPPFGRACKRIEDRETVKRRHHRGRGAKSGRPTLFSMLIIITAHLPIFTLQRQEGRIFAPMAYTIVSALIGSLLFSVTLVPLLAYFLLRKGVPHGENFVVRWCKALYRPALTAGGEASRDRAAGGGGGAGRHV